MSAANQSRLWLALFFLLSVFVSGYAVHYGNHPIQLPLVQKLVHPELYPHDPYVDTGRTYASLLWPAVAVLARWFDLYKIILIGWLLERLLVLYAAGRLARAFFPDSRLAEIAAWAWFALMPQQLLANGTIATDYFEQTGLSIPFFLLAMAAFQRRDRLWWAVWLAVAFDLNSMYGVFAATYFGAVFLLDREYRGEWRRWIAPAGALLLLISPALVLSARTFGLAGVSDKLWLAVAWARRPEHLYPRLWPRRSIAIFVWLMLLSTAALYAAWERNRRLFRHLLVWHAVALAWIAFACFAAYVAPSPSLLMFQAGRATDLWCCFVMIALVTSLGAGLEWGPRAILPLAVFLHVYLLWAPELPQWLPLVVLAIGLWPWGWRRIFRGGDPRVAIALVLVVIGVVLALHSRARLANHGHPFNNSRFPGASLSIIRWARRATSPDAVFLVDPEWSYFREMAQRPVYVTWKDGSAMLWNRPYAATWLERMRALGFDPLAAKVRDAVHGAARGQNSYQALDESQVEAIRAQAPVTFWVAPADHVSPWPEVFTNGAYRVLRVPAAP